MKSSAATMGPLMYEGPPTASPRLLAQRRTEGLWVCASARRGPSRPRSGGSAGGRPGPRAADRSRPFVEYNACHILEAVNVNCSKTDEEEITAGQGPDQ